MIDLNINKVISDLIKNKYDDKYIRMESTLDQI